ncbi:fused MFS/spermidine synthase [Pseudoalteromonas luteoviolacea]|uniref:spermidine synthase n=1 Tax=Pseudoalteromonas luteoviolacea TaxID=43657 RepID=UPI001F3994FE|nr:fused MFS/spermidine synthase [Pseudoalteromonas luteoviolacea]MCF6439323.1 fused MFS/spermidine synthase [Pseudoalteromonas luteoviolacea]
MAVLFTLIILLSAFLLFQIQPILSKEQLSQFGGGASVWSAGLFFFQACVLLGYLYIHLIRHLRLQWQIALHLTLLIMAMTVTYTHVEKSILDMLPPTWSVVVALAAQIGPIFIMLSTTSVLLQKWYCLVNQSPVPYHWYAISNFGSLVALLTFPFIFEVYFGLTTLKEFWFLALLVLVTLFFLLKTLLIQKIFQGKCINQIKPATVIFNNHFLCISLAALSSLLLSSTTFMINVNIPPMPLTWLMPLAIYLITFIIAFSLPVRNRSFYSYSALIFATLAGILMYFLGSKFNAVAQFSMYGLILLICTFSCHRELRRIAPNHYSMTSFYVCIAFGSVLGSLTSSIIAPATFNLPIEYPLTLIAIFSLHIYLCTQSSVSKYIKFGYMSVFMSTICGFGLLNNAYTNLNVITERNFYGMLTVKDITINNTIERRLIDGTTIHGYELMNDISSDKGYYHQSTGIAKAIEILQANGPINMGIIGLGAGVLAQYGKKHDTITFYELNPAVFDVAKKYFSYLDNSLASINVKIGDGRQLVAKEISQSIFQQDAIVIDAFTSDVIPTHLLTVEAFELYWQRMHNNGVLVMHISNNHIDLMPIMASQSLRFDKSLLLFDYQGDENSQLGSKWAIMTSNEEFLRSMPVSTLIDRYAFTNQSTAQWTDEKHSLLPYIKL